MAIREIAGKKITFDESGFMADPGEWNPEVAAVLADEAGIANLTEDHWRAIEFCRTDYELKGESPTLRRIKKVGGIPTKMLYKLFPKGPAKKIAYVSGLGKPSGCI